MSFDIAKYFSTKATSQSKAIPGTTQVANSGGGFSWEIDDWTRLDRFLILGSEGGTFYISERALTIDNAAAVLRCIGADGVRAVGRIAAISTAGRAPKNDPAIFALAMAAKLGDDATRAAAYAALRLVCRTGTHLLHFARYAEAFGGWGRGMRKAVAGWFNAQPADKLAYQLVKYQSRDGWSSRDLLRLAHPRAASPSHDRLFHWVTRGSLPDGAASDPSLALVEALERAKAADSAAEVVRLIGSHKLPREAVPTRWLKEAAVWEALLADMPLTAMIRNLGTMTKVGLLAPMGRATTTVVERLGDARRLNQARIHPLAVLAALLTYKSGRGVRGSGTWSPVAAVVDALDAAFYTTFRSVEPANKRMLLALDVSGSMASGVVGGVRDLTPRMASAAMALVTAASERDHGFVAFTGGHAGRSSDASLGAALTELAISPRQRLDDAVATVSGLSFGNTDCALPMLWAKKKKVAVDTFVIYTDSETWVGSIHPVQALRAYRDATGIPAKLVVVGMTSNGFSIADPDDAGMLDVVGFDTATPPILADFARS
jgi:60 kDa SS-A/Ro ribonucleoprotein